MNLVDVVEKIQDKNMKISASMEINLISHLQNAKWEIFQNKCTQFEYKNYLLPLLLVFFAYC